MLWSHPAAHSAWPPLIAGMLQYGVSRALKSKERNVQGTEAWCLVVATECVDPDEASEFISDLLRQIFRDARVKADRETARGFRYSIIEEAIQEFVRWEYMPWE
jgi:hypothetical protein